MTDEAETICMTVYVVYEGKCIYGEREHCRMLSVHLNQDSVQNPLSISAVVLIIEMLPKTWLLG